MKATKNQAGAVRSYLSSIGHEITHVQALEVIARGNGFRSRHAMANGDLTAASKAEEQSAPKRRKKVPKACRHCGQDLQFGFCDDMTCPYSNWPQVVEYNDMCNMSGEALEAKYGVKQRPDLDADEIDLQESLPEQYGENGEHPDYPRQVWEHQVSVGLACWPYWTWVATKLNPNNQTETAEAAPCIEMSSELFGSETFEYDNEADRERGLMRLIAAAVTQKDDVPREYRFFEATPDTPDGGTTYGELEATVYGDGVVELRGETFARPELTRVEGDLVFTGRNLPEEPVGKAAQEKLCLYNILSDSEECGTDVCPYSTPEKREAGLMRMLANDVLQDDGIARRYWRYERDLQVGDEVRIPAPSSVSQDKDAFGAVKSIDYAARRFVVTVSGVDIPFEFEMLALMTLPFIDRIANTQARLIMRKAAHAVFAESGDVILDGQHYNKSDIRLKEAHGDQYFVPKK